MPNILIKAMPKGLGVRAHIHHYTKSGEPVYQSEWEARERWLKRRKKAGHKHAVSVAIKEGIVEAKAERKVAAAVESLGRAYSKEIGEVMKPMEDKFLAKVRKPKTELEQRVLSFIEDWPSRNVPAYKVRWEVGQGMSMDDFMDLLEENGYELFNNQLGMFYIKKAFGKVPMFLMLSKSMMGRIKAGLHLLPSKINSRIKRWQKTLRESPANAGAMAKDWKQGVFDSRYKNRPKDNSSRSYLLGFHAGMIKRSPSLMQKHGERLTRLLQEARSRGISIAKSFDDSMDLIKGKARKNDPKYRLDPSKHRYVLTTAEQKPQPKLAKPEAEGQRKPGQPEPSGTTKSQIHSDVLGGGKEPPVKVPAVSGAGEHGGTGEDEEPEKAGDYAKKFNRSIEKIKDVRFSNFVAKDAEAEGDKALKDTEATGYNVATYDVAGDDYTTKLFDKKEHNYIYHNYTHNTTHAIALLNAMEKEGLEPEYSIMLKASAVQWGADWAKEEGIDYGDSFKKKNNEGVEETFEIGKSAEYSIIFNCKDKAEVEKVNDFMVKKAMQNLEDGKTKNPEAVKDSWVIPDIRYSNAEKADELEKRVANYKRMKTQNVIILSTKEFKEGTGYRPVDVYINKGLADFIKSLLTRMNLFKNMTGSEPAEDGRQVPMSNEPDPRPKKPVEPLKKEKRNRPPSKDTGRINWEKEDDAKSGN